MPATVNSGDLLLAIAAFDSSSTTITTPSGWTRIIGNAKDPVVGVYAKVADGTEDGTNVNFVTSNSQRGSVHVLRFTAWAGNLDPGVRAVIGAAASTGSGATLGVGASADVHWVAFQAKSSGGAWGTAPSGYSNENKTNVSEDSLSSASIASAARTNTAAFEEVATMWNSTNGFITGLIAVLPA
jgi:hypothetical protein